MTKAKTESPAKVPTKAEILEYWQQIDAKFPNTGQPIFELAQLDRSGFYWQFIGLCEQAEKLANADCSPDEKQAGIIELFKNFVYVEKQINEAKANAEQAKAERIRELQNELEHAKEVASHYNELEHAKEVASHYNELEHAKEVASHYIDLDKCFLNSLSDILNSPCEFTEAEITRAYCCDIETLRCHQWEAIGKKIARDFADQHPEQFPDAISRNELMQMFNELTQKFTAMSEDRVAKFFAEVNSILYKIGKDTAEIKKNQKTGKPEPLKPQVAADCFRVTIQTIYRWTKPDGRPPEEWRGLDVTFDCMRQQGKLYQARRAYNTDRRTDNTTTVYNDDVKYK